jgi:hypothetical protein
MQCSRREGKVNQNAAITKENRTKVRLMGVLELAVNFLLKKR